MNKRKPGRPVNQARAAAKNAGNRFYYGSPCAFDHVGLRYVSTHACAHCMANRPTGYRDSDDEKRLLNVAIVQAAIGE